MPRPQNFTKTFNYRWQIDPHIQVDTLNIIVSYNIHTSSHFVPITQKNLPSLTLVILIVKKYKTHTA